MEIIIKAFTNTDISEFINELANLRIEIFREFPYLYDGNKEYEKNYLQTFLEAKDSILVGAFDQGKIIGASTGMPLQYETENIKKPFEEMGFNLSKIFYFSESVLKKTYRNRGIGSEFFKIREAWVDQLKTYTSICFCSVMRPNNHPKKPVDYIPLNTFWKKRGYKETHDKICYISWKGLDEKEETPKPLKFWVKQLEI